MEALIKAKAYHDRNTLINEYEHVFHKIWHFVGFKEDLTKENDFITLTIGSTPVVIQKLRGSIRAYRNICSHRHSIIQTERKGNRPLMCPYHGWTYDQNGVPRGIPKKPLFNFTENELNCLKLDQFSVESCGQLIFVNISTQHSSLLDYLGVYYEKLALMSDNFGRRVDENSMVIEANWKILVENTLESYHVNLVHSDTFKNLGTDGLKFEFDNYHSSWITDLKMKEDDKKVKRIHEPFQNRKYRISGYEHISIFPNVLISSTYGISFNLSTIIPLNEGQSLFTSYVFLTNSEYEENKNALVNTYSESLIKFNRAVFNEDKEICEQVQKGVVSSNFTGQLSQEEERVCSFQKSYNDFFNI
ncbi:aromatic ring-hydroxylating dioxygenase subunit alpha [Schleiferiaceae bacterium]|nr:aromatic ring-hydroxylating dioxygenase subunit alpha [Schleiferiaceae bacterium]